MHLNKYSFIKAICMDMNDLFNMASYNTNVVHFI